MRRKNTAQNRSKKQTKAARDLSETTFPARSSAMLEVMALHGSSDARLNALTSAILAKREHDVDLQREFSGSDVSSEKMRESQPEVVKSDVMRHASKMKTHVTSAEEQQAAASNPCSPEMNGKTLEEVLNVRKTPSQ